MVQVYVSNFYISDSKFCDFKLHYSGLLVAGASDRMQLGNVYTSNVEFCNIVNTHDDSDSSDGKRKGY